VLRELNIWLKKDGVDVDLGKAYSDDVPRQGDLLGHGSETLRVLFVYKILTQPYSPRYLRWQSGKEFVPIWVDVFVERVDGPFEPRTGGPT
jgi:hypothetical protein